MQNLNNFILERLKLNKNTKIENSVDLMPFISKYGYKFKREEFGYKVYETDETHNKIIMHLIYTLGDIGSFYSYQRNKCVNEINEKILSNDILINTYEFTTNIEKKAFNGLGIIFKKDNKEICKIEINKLYLRIRKESYDFEYEDLYNSSLEYLVEFSNKIK